MRIYIFCLSPLPKLEWEASKNEKEPDRCGQARSVVSQSSSGANYSTLVLKLSLLDLVDSTFCFISASCFTTNSVACIAVTISLREK